jgi:hypothetical protein
MQLAFLGVDVRITIFQRFFPISGGKIGVFLQNQWHYHFLHQQAVFWVKNVNFSAKVSLKS